MYYVAHLSIFIQHKIFSVATFGNNKPYIYLSAQMYGARPLKRWVEKHIVTTISKMMVSGEVDEGSTISIDAADDKKGLKYHVA
jgi:hypothetical protein